MNNAHKNLVLWKESFNLVKMVYSSTKDFPQEEKYGLVSQLKRASISIPTNIAEGAARKSKKEFLNFLSIARGSLAEIDTLILLSEDLCFINSSQSASIMNKLQHISILLSGLMKKVNADIVGFSE
jgi:four helix bundle protein